MNFINFQLIAFIIMQVCNVQSQNYHEIQNFPKRIKTSQDNNNQYSNEDDFNEAVSGNSNLDNLNDIDDIGDAAGAFFETIPGEPKRDYPTYKAIPKTGFSCKGRVNWGYYADVETSCQVFHVCESENSKISFLCPVGSAFNQKHLVCDWWYNFDCHDEISLTSLFDDYDILHNSSSEKIVAKRRGNDYEGREVEEEEDYDNDGGLYDLNLVSSGGNV